MDHGLIDPKGIVDFVLMSYNLTSVQRFHTVPKVLGQNVAEHSYYVTLLSGLVSHLENYRNLFSDEQKYDKATILERSYIHDLEEALTGDIIFSVHSVDAKFKKALNKLRNRFVDEFVFVGLPEHTQDFYKTMWKTTKDNTKEGRLLAHIDKLDVLFYSYNEICAGNGFFKKHFLKAYSILKESSVDTVREIAEELYSRYTAITGR